MRAMNSLKKLDEFRYQSVKGYEFSQMNTQKCNLAPREDIYETLTDNTEPWITT